MEKRICLGDCRTVFSVEVQAEDKNCPVCASIYTYNLAQLEKAVQNIRES
jgi:hypothetical protein